MKDTLLAEVPSSERLARNQTPIKSHFKGKNGSLRLFSDKIDSYSSSNQCISPKSPVNQDRPLNVNNVAVLGGCPDIEKTHLTDSIQEKTKTYPHINEQNINIFYEYRWRSEDNGSVSLCIYRKKGCPYIHCHVPHNDNVPKFHREKAFPSLDKGQEDHLCNDRFLTGNPNAETLDVIKSPRNRSLLEDNPGGPFSYNFLGCHLSKVDHLDRICQPRLIPREMPPNLGKKKRVLCYGNKEHIFAKNGFLVGDELREDNNDLSSEAQLEIFKSPQRYQGRARIIAPWTPAPSSIF